MNGIRKKAILFDKDGTLIEYNTIWPEATRAMIPLFRIQFDVNENMDDEELLEKLGLGKQKVEDSTAIASGTTWDIAQVLTQSLSNENGDVLPFVRNYFYQYTIDHQAKIKAIGDIKQLFTSLKDAGYLLGLVTADDYESTMFTLKHLEIEHLLHFVATGDRYKAKPEPEAIQAFSSSASIPMEQVLFVGDSIVDMQFGKHCRKGIAVLSGVGDKEKLKQYTDAIYPTIHDIPYELYLD